MSRIKQIVAVASATLVFASLSATPALAHAWSDWHEFRWTTTVIDGIQTDRNVDWRFVDNFPTGDGGRSRVVDAANRWENVGTSLKFNYQSSQPDWGSLGWGTCSSNYQYDKVGWTAIGASGFSNDEPLGQASSCRFGSTPTAGWDFRIRFNKDAPWYKGTDSVPSGKYDLFSVAMHEFGHVTGRTKGGDGSGHFKESSSYCPGPSSSSWSERHTMCPSTYSGTSLQRTLEAHDSDVLQNAY